MLTKVLCVLTLMALPLPLSAAEKEKAAPLTPKEIAAGWILLFDGESTFGWKPVGDAAWSVKDGTLKAEPGKEGRLVTTSAFENYKLVVECRVSEGTRSPLIISCDATGKKVGEEETNPVPTVRDWLRMEMSVTGGRLMSLEAPAVSIGFGKPFNPKTPWKGHLAIQAGAEVRSIKLKPTDLMPVFNGKDLTGWKEHPGKMSKFTVTDDACIHLKDGPGDLQSEGQWADFVLQVECKSNGDYLNSGVFFRCIPGQYQNGYECQIHNKFAAEPSKEYTIEEYDPQTHALKDKKKVKFAATDYGTGAVYRRMPARKQMSKDREWFTMTIVADGRHLATWVNGYPEVDWTDNRPANNNPRNGAKVEKGPISLQGHDATTDLLFRNIRIAELTR